MNEGYYYQNAYVTRDADAAAARIKAMADVRFESGFDDPVEVAVPGASGPMRSKVVLLWTEDFQYELIQPISGLVDIYTDALPHGDGLAFHHVCRRVNDWAAFRTQVDRQPIPLRLEGSFGPVKILYLDSRPQLGHYLESVASQR